MTYFWAALVALLLAGVLRRKRNRRKERISDEMVQGIEAHGRLVMDDVTPLDEEYIRQEEERFWRDERWDEANPFPDR